MPTDLDTRPPSRLAIVCAERLGASAGVDRTMLALFDALTAATRALARSGT